MTDIFSFESLFSSVYLSLAFLKTVSIQCGREQWQSCEQVPNTNTHTMRVKLRITFTTDFVIKVYSR